MAKIQAKDLTVGMTVVVTQFGERKSYKLKSVQHFPPLPHNKTSEGFISVGTEEWDRGIPGLGGNLDTNEEVEIE